ncbi:MAG: site-specific DNA-methyltransferase [Turicibacter sp.]|nr:site-specific DNA-methyltransferase [Turicibacter sp.]
MLKPNHIYNECCLMGMSKIPDNSIDMVLCDLPYGMTKNKWDTPLDLGVLWWHYKRIVKPNGAILLFAKTPFDKVLGASNLDMLKYEWIWVKSKATGFLNAKKMPLQKHENILAFYQKPPDYFPQFSVGAPYKAKRNGGQSDNYGVYKGVVTESDGKRYPTTQLYFPSEKTTIHPTQKPVALFEYLIKTYTREGDTVLDNCMGSGTTAVACLNTGRNFIGFEKDAEYHRLALERIGAHESGQMSIAL